MKRSAFRTKPSPIRAQKRKTWQALSRFVRARDPFCVTCSVQGKQVPSSEAGHYKHNSDKVNAQIGGNALWYDLRNINGQCTRCNSYNSGELDLYALYLEKKHGPGILQELELLYRTPKKWTLDELIALQETFESAAAALA